jgi:oxygen-independent coproporphyrinogen-3 oxidase
MAAELNKLELLPLSLYVHFPWCVRKCPYCDFNSHTMGDDDQRERYLDALLVDLDHEAQRTHGRALISVFLGGGTPSVFTPQQMARLIEKIDQDFALADDIEITMEANPGTVECGDPAGYRAAGVNRLSVGAQSFSSQALKTLGRIHSVDDIRRSVDEARAAGFENINADLMYGLPGQSVEAAVFDIEQGALLEVDHISWYQLTLEPNTVFHARPPAGMPGGEAAYDIQSAGEERLANHGFQQYEVSAWARDGKCCRHNLNYWTFGDYLAVGAGAHGKVSDGTGIWRYAKAANPKQYMETLEKGDEEAELREVEEPDRLFEFMLNVSRLNEGFSGSQFEDRTGLPAELLRERLSALVERGLVSESGGDLWRVTPLGRRFLNDLQAEFLPD